METTAGSDLRVYSGGNMKPLACILTGVFLALIVNIIVLIMIADKDSYKADVSTAGTAAAAGFQDDSNKIIIAVDEEWPPYCYSDSSDPNNWAMPEGLLYSVAKEACIDQGLDCEFVLMSDYSECWTEKHAVGTNLVNNYYDMCLCWTPVWGRLRRTIWPNNDDDNYNQGLPDGALKRSKGFSNAPTGGFLVKKDLSDAEVLRFRARFEDGCQKQFMLQAEDTEKWYHCPDNKDISPLDDSTLSAGCEKECPDGIIRVGFIQGWATNQESFGWIKNRFTNDLFQVDRLEFIDEHAPGGSKEAIKTYNHMAQALERGDIDVGYVYDTVLNDMSNKNCNVCTDIDIWNDGTLKLLESGGIVQKGFLFAAGGPSGFFRPGSTALRDAISTGAENFINKKDKYCPMCRKYFPTKNDCNAV